MSLASFIAALDESDDPDLALVDRIVATTRDRDLAALVEACALPRRFDAEIVGVLRGRPEDAAGNARLLRELCEYPFVKPREAGGFVYHDGVRVPLLARFREERRDPLRELTGRLVAHFEAAHATARLPRGGRGARRADRAEGQLRALPPAGGDARGAAADAPARGRLSAVAGVLARGAGVPRAPAGQLRGLRALHGLPGAGRGRARGRLGARRRCRRRLGARVARATGTGGCWSRWSARSGPSACWRRWRPCSRRTCGCATRRSASSRWRCGVSSGCARRA